MFSWSLINVTHLLKQKHVIIVMVPHFRIRYRRFWSNYRWGCLRIIDYTRSGACCSCTALCVECCCGTLMEDSAKTLFTSWGKWSIAWCIYCRIWENRKSNHFMFLELQIWNLSVQGISLSLCSYKYSFICLFFLRIRNEEMHANNISCMALEMLHDILKKAVMVNEKVRYSCKVHLYYQWFTLFLSKRWSACSRCLY